MIARHGGRPAGARKKREQKAVGRQRSSMAGSDGDDSSSDRGGYSDESEPELEAGCMGVRGDAREKKKDKPEGGGRLRTAAFSLIFLGLGACLPFVFNAALDRTILTPGSAAASSGVVVRARNTVIAAVKAPSAAVASDGILVPAASVVVGPVSAAALAGGGGAAWGAASDKTKDALRMLVKGSLSSADVSLRMRLQCCACGCICMCACICVCVRF